MQFLCSILLFTTVAAFVLAIPIQLSSGIDPSNTHVVLVSAIECANSRSSNDDCAEVYGIEAEVAHVYHLLIEKGVPKDNIVTLFKNNSCYGNYTQPYGSLYDDLNYSRNWQPGLKIDYSHDDVTPQNFLAVIQGNASALNHKKGTGRVLKTTEASNIFVYHGGHGLPGVLYYSNDLSQFLTAKELQSTFLSMQRNKQFNQMLLQIASCYSGSMFEDFLTKQGNILALTAADSEQTALFKDCIIAGSKDYCLHTEFGWAFVIDDAENDPEMETIDEQYRNMREIVIKSNVSKYGSLAVSSEATAYFHGSKKLSAKPKNTKTMNIHHEFVKESIPISPIALYLRLKRRLARAESVEEIAELQERLTSMEKERDEMQELSLKMVTMLAKSKDRKIHEKLVNSLPSSITAVDCHHDVMKAFAHECSKLSQSPFILELTRPLINLCEHGVEAGEIISKLQEHCV